MPDGLRVPYSVARTKRGDAVLRPQVAVTLTLRERSVRATGLLDSGADVNVLPFRLGIELGADWPSQMPLAPLSGNLAGAEARGIVLDAAIGSLAPVRLAFAWTRAEDVPLLLGQVNFFAEFDVCFFRSRGFVEVRRRPVSQ
jgi:hypothetical protein